MDIEPLKRGARKIVKICAGVKSGEKVLIITDPLRPASVAEALAMAVEEQGSEPTIIKAPLVGVSGQEPNRIVAAAMLQADVIFAPTTRTIGHSNALSAALKKGARALTLTECTEQILISGAIEADFAALQPIVEDVEDSFNRAGSVHVTTREGTDLHLDITDRRAVTCSGMCHQPGRMIGIPDVEVYIAPVEEKTEGNLMINASCSIIGLVETPIALQIENGRVASIQGGKEAKQLENILKQIDDPAVWVVAEFAIGLNPAGSIIGSIIVDEGVYGTGHFALGNNVFFGGRNPCAIHLDLVYYHPTIELDGRLFMKEGELTHGHKSLKRLD